MTGKTGVGKSTLVNALIGSNVVEVGRGLKSDTKKVASYSKTEKGVKIVVWDSPGLQDGTECDITYLTDMKEKCRNIDLILYCIDSSAKRSELGPGQRDFLAIQKFTDTFDDKFWENAVFVLTRGNTMENDLRDIGEPVIEQAFRETVNKWEAEIQSALKSIRIPEEIVSNIPIVPAGHVNKPNLPGHQFWLSGLWFTVADCIKDSSKLDLIALNEHRMTEISQITPGSFNKDGPQQPIVVDYANTDQRALELTAKGVGGGFAVGVAAGAAIGGGAGAVAGSVVPGLGNIVGAAVGAAVGGAIGGVVGGTSVGGLSGFATYMAYKLHVKKLKKKKS